MIEVRLILQCLFYDIMKKLIDAGCVAFSANTDGFFIAANGVDVQPFIGSRKRSGAWSLTTTTSTSTSPRTTTTVSSSRGQSLRGDRRRLAPPGVQL